MKNLPPKDYFFEDDTATYSKETGRSYHSNYLSPSLSYSDSYSQRDEEERRMEKEIKDLGF